MSKVFIILGLAIAGLVIAIAGHFVWQLHPWVRAGQSFALGSWTFGEFEFRAWQVKNVSKTEPFTDGLFARRGTNQWELFCFDIQDSYSPKVRLQKNGSRIVVYRDGEKRGDFDMVSQKFRREGQSYESGRIIVDTPPGQWWSK